MVLDGKRCCLRSASPDFAPAIAPERVSVMAGAAVAVRTPPTMLVQRTVWCGTRPRSSRAFAARQEALRQNPGRPLDISDERARAAQPQTRADGAAR